jgi:hypothetical protein
MGRRPALKATLIWHWQPFSAAASVGYDLGAGDETASNRIHLFFGVLRHIDF